MLAGVVLHASEGARNLANLEGVRLADVGAGEAQAGELLHNAGLAVCRGFVRKGAVPVGKKRLGGLVRASNLEAELARGHIAAVEGLGDVDARVLRVLDVVAVDELALALEALHGSLELTRGHVVGHGHAEFLDVLVVVDTGGGAGDLADGVVVDARSSKGDGAEVDRGTAGGLLGVFGGDGHPGLGGHRGAIGLGGELELKGVGSDPIAALKGFDQAEVGGHEVHGLRRVGVVEGNLGAGLAVDGRGHAQSAVEGVFNGDDDLVLGGVVGHAGQAGGVVGHDLADLELEGLPGVGLGEHEAVELGHRVLLARSALAVIGERSVGVGEKRLGGLILTGDSEAELALAHSATGQGLGDGDAGVGEVGDVVGVDEVDAGAVGVIGGLDNELAVLVLDHDGYGASPSVVRHTGSGLLGHDLADREDIGARFGERGGPEVEVLSDVVLCIGNLGGRLETRNASLRPGNLRQRERELLVIERIAPDQGLGAVDKALNHDGVGLVAIGKGNRLALGRLGIGDIATVDGIDDDRAVVSEAHGDGDVPDGRVIRHAVDAIVDLAELILKGLGRLVGVDVILVKLNLPEGKAAGCVNGGRSLAILGVRGHGGAVGLGSELELEHAGG